MVPAADLRLATAHTPGRCTVSVGGEIDVLTSAELRAFLCDAVDASAGNADNMVVVDLSGVTFMDASGLTALIVAEEHTCRRGSRLQLAAVPPRVSRLLHITGLDRHFHFHPGERDGRLPSGHGAEPHAEAVVRQAQGLIASSSDG